MSTVKNIARAAQDARPVGFLRVACITYQDTPLTIGGELSIGDIIDTRVAEIVRSGYLVSEVTVHFGTREEQETLAHVYRERT